MIIYMWKTKLEHREFYRSAQDHPLSSVEIVTDYPICFFHNEVVIRVIPVQLRMTDPAVKYVCAGTPGKIDVIISLTLTVS